MDIFSTYAILIRDVPELPTCLFVLAMVWSWVIVSKQNPSINMKYVFKVA